MSEPALSLEPDAGRARVGPILSRQQSTLFASLFQLFDVNHRLCVLEIGTALPETIDFFAQFKCRLHFVDLFNEPFVRNQDDLSETELRHGFEEHLRFPAGTKFDLCLFWDFVCYLDDPALRAFNSAMRPWLHAGTRAHGFGVHHLAVRLDNIRYGIEDRNTFCQRERRDAPMGHHPHSQIEMHEMLNCLMFDRGLLLPDGKLEMLLKTRV